MQFMTGHNYLGYHNHLVNGDDPHCSLCGMQVPQDTEHIIAHCGYFLLLRQEIFLTPDGLLQAPFDDLPIGKVLQFLHQSGLEALDWKTDGEE